MLEKPFAAPPREPSSKLPMTYKGIIILEKGDLTMADLKEDPTLKGSLGA